jgi:hypothetical protein
MAINIYILISPYWQGLFFLKKKEAKPLLLRKQGSSSQTGNTSLTRKQKRHSQKKPA